MSSASEDLEEMNKVFRNKKYQLTPSELTVKKLYHTVKIPYSDICWVCVRKTKNTLYGVIPLDSAHDVLLYYSQKSKPIVIKMAGAYGIGHEEQSKEIMKIFMSVAPWAFFGYSPELEHNWNKNREEFVKIIRKRYEKLK